MGNRLIPGRLMKLSLQCAKLQGGGQGGTHRRVRQTRSERGPGASRPRLDGPLGEPTPPHPYAGRGPDARGTCAADLLGIEHRAFSACGLLDADASHQGVRVAFGEDAQQVLDGLELVVRDCRAAGEEGTRHGEVSATGAAS